MHKRSEGKSPLCCVGAGRWGLLALAMNLASCLDDSPSGSNRTELGTGTWGGDGVGVIVGDEFAHVHVGCTKGDFQLPIALDESLRFSVSGEYLLSAYPVAVGPALPARFAGVVRGGLMTLTVAVSDTIEGRLVVLGPVTASLGREPDMGPCPICAPG